MDDEKRGSKTIQTTNCKYLVKGVEHTELTLGSGILAIICYLTTCLYL